MTAADLSPYAGPYSPTRFENLARCAPDPLLVVTQLYRADPRAEKIDVGVGVYRDDAGRTPVLGAVKEAEGHLVEHQPTKAYLSPEGDRAFLDQLAALALGERVASDERLVGVQTPGGTGALRLAAELIARVNPAATVWLGEPTWPIHRPIFEAAGLSVATYRFFDARGQALDIEALHAALGEARPGDVFLMHGCCHNPTGADLGPHWPGLAEQFALRGLVPLVDLAYQGLGHGWDSDAEGLRLVLHECEQALIAYSCDKNFGLYRERVGALWAWTAGADASRRAHENLLALARYNWSMPPDHGAAVVRTILESARLTALWLGELETMRRRIVGLRQELASSRPAFRPLARQTGMFSLLPVTSADVESLRLEHAIYMPASGRLNVAGLRSETLPRFAAAVAPYLENS